MAAKNVAWPDMARERDSDSEVARGGGMGGGGGALASAVLLVLDSGGRGSPNTQAGSCIDAPCLPPLESRPTPCFCFAATSMLPPSPDPQLVPPSTLLSLNNVPSLSTSFEAAGRFFATTTSSAGLEKPSVSPSGKGAMLTWPYPRRSNQRSTDRHASGPPVVNSSTWSSVRVERRAAIGRFSLTPRRDTSTLRYCFSF